MPKNNPYDKELTPGRQLLSNIFFVLIILVLAAFILWVIFSQPKNVRTDFDPVSTPLTFSGEESEFFSLYEYLEQPRGVSPAFLEEYPTAAALLQKQAPLWREQKPFVESTGGGAALAYSYNSTADKTLVCMDVLAFSAALEGEEFRLQPPLRYTVQYNTSTGEIKKTELRTDRYRLSFYKLGLSFQSEGEAVCSVRLSAVVSDKEAEDAGLLRGITLSPQTREPSLSRLSQTSEVSGLIAAGEGSVSLLFGDLMYDYFDGISIRADGLREIFLSLN